jgi:hypothetical protein
MSSNVLRSHLRRKAGGTLGTLANQGFNSPRLQIIQKIHDSSRDSLLEMTSSLCLSFAKTGSRFNRFSWIPQVCARARSRLRRTSVAVHALLVERDRLRCFRDQPVETRIAAQLIPARI